LARVYDEDADVCDWQCFGQERDLREVAAMLDAFGARELPDGEDLWRFLAPLRGGHEGEP
jgi:hypothetical protein